MRRLTHATIRDIHDIVFWCTLLLAFNITIIVKTIILLGALVIRFFI